MLWLLEVRQTSELLRCSRAVAAAAAAFSTSSCSSVHPFTAVVRWRARFQIARVHAHVTRRWMQNLKAPKSACEVCNDVNWGWFVWLVCVVGLCGWFVWLVIMMLIVAV